MRTHTTAVSARMLYKLAQQVSNCLLKDKINLIDLTFVNEFILKTKFCKYCLSHQLFGKRKEKHTKYV